MSRLLRCLRHGVLRALRSAPPVLAALGLILLAAPLQAQSIVFINPGHADEAFWRSASQAMEAAARSLGLKLEVLYAGRDPERTLALSQELAQRPAGLRPDYVILSNDKGVLVPCAQNLAAAGIKSFAAFSGLLPQEQARYSPRRGLPLLLGSLEPRAQDAGYLSAKALLEQGLARRMRGADGRLHLVSIAGDRSTPSSIQRNQGLRQALAEHPQVDLAAQTFADWRRDQARDRMRGLLQRGPAPQLVWAGSDLMAFGAMDAAESLGLKPGRDLLFAAINTSDEAMQALIDGRLSALVGGHFLTGAFALVMLHDLHQGRDFIDEGLSLERPLFMRFDRAAAQRFLARPDLRELDFRRFSKVHNPRLRRYDFNPQVLLDSGAKH